MDAVTVFAIVTLVGLGLIVLGALLFAFVPNFGRGHGSRALSSQVDSEDSSLQKLIAAIVWAFKKALGGFFKLLGPPGKMDAGQKLMAVGAAVLFVGVVGLAISLIASIGSDDGGGTSTSTSTSTTTSTTSTTTPG